MTEYQREQERKCKANPKKFWEYINTHRQNKGYPDHIEYDGIKTRNETEAANMLNEFFATVFAQKDENFNIDEFLQDENITDEEIEPITLNEVLLELKSTDVGLDGIHPLILKNCAAGLSKVICAIFNKTIELGAIPQRWKKMKIIPIHKTGTKNSVKQYRPIAIPPCLAKILDKIMTGKLNAKLQDKILLNQHGFVKKRNTTTSLLELAQRA